MNEKICRLCLQTITENYDEIGEALYDILKLDLAISKDTVACVECRKNLQVFFKLKSACADMRERMLSATDLKGDDSLAPAKNENTNNLKPVTGPEDETRCRFCTKDWKIGEEHLISLYESKENIFLLDILKKYIPELNSSNIGELLTCKTCLDEMQSVSNFLLKCLDVEEKISQYTEIEGTDDKSQIELQDVQQFAFKPALKYEGDSCHAADLRYSSYDHIGEELSIKSEGGTIYKTEVDNTEPIVKIEEFDIGQQQSYYDSFQESLVENKLDTDYKNSTDVTVYVCRHDTCTYVTTYEDNFSNHILIHKIRPGIKKFKCELCEFETNHKGSLNKHILIHKSPSEIKMFKCETCPFETKRKYCLTVHTLIHKSSSEVTMYKCAICAYETKLKKRLREHVLTHKSPSEITLFKCELCTVEVKRKRHLKRHMLTHKNPSELTKFKCDTCPFETIHKCALKRHMLTHEQLMCKRANPLKTKKYKCEMCEYETKHKYAVNTHMLIHKNPSEVTMYKCDICTYATKRKYHLIEHRLTHKDASDITLFKCELCKFQTKRNRALKRHRLIHENPSEVTKVKCKTCAFETIYKYDLKRHMLRHKHCSEVTG